MAMALAAVVMAGAAVSCDPMDNDDENTEQTDDTQNGNENEGTENEDDQPAVPTLEGKQWIYDAETPAMFYDFGVYASGKLYEGYYAAGYAMNVVSSDYVFDATDATSGKVTLSGLPYYAEPTDYAYRNLTATTVEIDGALLGYTPGEFLTLKVVETPITWEEE